MPTLEERVAFLEGKVEEHSRGFAELQESIGRTDGHVLALDAKVDRFRQELASRIDALDQKIDGFRHELSGRIDGLAARIDRQAGRIDGLDQKIDRFSEELSSRIDSLDQKVSRQFTWIVGIQVAMFVALIGSFLTLFGSLVQG